MSFGSVGHDRDGITDLFFNEFDVIAAVFRKVFVVPDAADVAFPAGKVDIYGFGLGEKSCHREFLCPDAVDLIGNTDRDLIEVAQNIEDCKCHVGRALQAASIAGCDTVIPAHTAGPSGGGAEFAAVTAARAEFIRLIPENLGDKFTRTDCGRVCFVDYDNLTDLVGRDPCSDRAEGCQCRGGSDHGINAVVRVFECAELTFEKDGLVFFDGLFKVLADISDIGCDHIPIAVDRVDELSAVDGIFVVEVCQENILLHTDALDFFQQLIVAHKELIDLPADLCVFIGIKRCDTGLSGAEGFACQTLFFTFVKEDVIGHDDLAALGNHQLRSGDASVLYAFQLIHEDRDVECHAVSDDIHDFLVEYTRRKGMQGKFSIVIDNGMSRICSALEADDDICAVCKGICDLSLAFVSPVCSYNCFNHNSFFPP